MYLFMSDKSSIEWTDATWNPTTGCSKVSPGCQNCYAERLSMRLKKMNNKKFEQGFTFTIHENALYLPLSWKKPKKIFVNSMSDLFHESMDFNFLKRCFNIMESANWHVYQILTKRPDRMVEFVNSIGGVSDHIWLGTSVEMALYKDRIDILRMAKANNLFISFEPLLGPVGTVNLSHISWIIVGGESGPKARPIRPEWVIELRDQALNRDIPFFFKQWGGKTPKSNGRLLDGRIWNNYPKDMISLNGRQPIQ